MDDIRYQRHRYDDLEDESDDLQLHLFSSCAGRDYPAPSAHINNAKKLSLFQAKSANIFAFICGWQFTEVGDSS
ncbi:hypothetical protein [Thalassovita aquimarina]|uniref:Uncharacterized protein n=1 Tax=Thalassovita aquimarina TaxID=2785917 RepID=A0ABS5HSR8_9RHOB|nr:hypothetical protein [Thalassovita aquimarina]MBR9651944.1 hypothetical protein [Thalassovita aquimarina]